MFLCFLQVRLFNERQYHFALTSSVAILKSGISSYARISLASFDHQRSQKEVSLLELSKTKSEYSTKRNIAVTRKIIFFPEMRRKLLIINYRISVFPKNTGHDHMYIFQ